MKIRASCTLDLHLEVETPLILMLRPKSGASQWVYREEYIFSHQVNVTEYQDTFGNLCQRLIAPAAEFRIVTASEVETADAMDECPGAPFISVDQLPADVLDYLVPSRYCESDRLGEFTLSLVGQESMGYDQVAAISDWIRRTMPYLPGTSEFPLSALEVRAQGHGVCRDMAHLAIAMCRSISIPARMV
ncbi:MAG: transglutaminase family protein, partial [Pseudomonadales bacterium]|nr:transglutaminase family protein [Pseudomonadales bacterium]